jgi:drug/metabolite transporter (DMT)-like permease
MRSLVRKPSAWAPVAMSAAALALLLACLALYSIPQRPEPDEGAVAHIWQILIGGQVPIIFFFAVVYLPRAPRRALAILTVQIAALLAAVAPVFLLSL